MVQRPSTDQPPAGGDDHDNGDSALPAPEHGHVRTDAETAVDDALGTSENPH